MELDIVANEYFLSKSIEIAGSYDYYEHLRPKCVFCGEKKNIHEHHIIPKACGGSDEDSNLEDLCGRCHFIIHVMYRKNSLT